MTFRRKCDVHLFLNCSGGASLLSVSVLLQNWQMQCTILLNRADQTITSVWLVHSLTSSPKISCEPHLLILFQLFYVALVDKREVGSQFWLFCFFPSLVSQHRWWWNNQPTFCLGAFTKLVGQYRSNVPLVLALWIYDAHSSSCRYTWEQSSSNFMRQSSGNLDMCSVGSFSRLSLEKMMPRAVGSLFFPSLANLFWSILLADVIENSLSIPFLRTYARAYRRQLTDDYVFLSSWRKRKRVRLKSNYFCGVCVCPSFVWQNGRTNGFDTHKLGCVTLLWP